MSGTLTGSEWIWKDGEFLPWADATVHVLSLAVQFGNSIFEGIRCYDTDDGPAIFQLDAHLRRLEHSCKIYRMEVPHSLDELREGCRSVIRKNGLGACYLRPTVVRGYGAAGMYPAGSPVETYLACWPWGAYLGEEALAQGVDVCVSTWNRPAPNTFPVLAKSAGHYNNAQLIKMEAVANGYAEAIVLGPSGVLSEGSGQNVFLVIDGQLVTPPLDGTSLAGITRRAVIDIADHLGIDTEERTVPRELLYIADELFFTGTASEITPIRSVDRIAIGSGARGPVTEKLQNVFMDVVGGRQPRFKDWLTPVNP